MAERPILFSAPMVRAILAGTKTQTRRVMARQKKYDFTEYTLFGQKGHPDDEAARRGGWAEPWKAIEHAPDWPDGKEDQCRCPYASHRGDRLWVREAWRTNGDDGRCNDMPPLDLQPHPVWYEADGTAPADECTGKLRPSIFMPRWASRITLEVTGVRVERLQAISEADARAEGCLGGHGSIPNYNYHATPVEQYRKLWESINGAGSWEANPWVWVVEFRRWPAAGQLFAADVGLQP